MAETALVQTILLTEAIRIGLDETKNTKDTAQVELILTEIGELVDLLSLTASQFSTSTLC